MRRSIATTLILAFLLALFAPVRVAWSCPDGTPCVHDGARGFVCAGNQCASRASCCQAKAVRCKHGATPSVQSSGPTRAGLDAPDHCRFSVSAAPKLTAVAESSKVFWMGVELALAPAPFQLTLSEPPPVWRSEFTLGYRPPPLLSLGPSRAPPAA